MKFQLDYIPGTHPAPVLPWTDSRRAVDAALAANADEIEFSWLGVHLRIPVYDDLCMLLEDAGAAELAVYPWRQNIWLGAGDLHACAELRGAEAISIVTRIRQSAGGCIVREDEMSLERYVGAWRGLVSQAIVQLRSFL